VASTVGARAGGSAASRSGSAIAAKGGGKAAAGRSAGKQAARRAGRSALKRVASSGGGRGRGEDQVFSRGFFWAIAIAGGGMTFFLVVIIAPLLVLQAASGSCGGEEGTIAPIRTNHEPDPADLTKTQIAIRIYLVGKVMHMTPRQILTGLDVAYMETKLRNVDGGDADSTGVFQQRNISPWIDDERNRNNVIDASVAFFLRLREVDEGQPIPVLAQDVQVSAHPERYFEWLDEAIDRYNDTRRLVGTAAGIRNIQSLQGVTITGGGLDTMTLGSACSGFAATGPANLKQSETLYQPRSYKTLPASVWGGEGSPQQVDTRIWQDAVWVMTNYHLKATAARETGHKTHGDGTALDMVPAEGGSQRVWDETALKLARDLGWTSECAESGISTSGGGSCNFVPAILFIGYNGFDSHHGDPQHSSSAHIHVTWNNSCYGCGGGELVDPRDWVKVFPVGQPTPAGDLPVPSLFPEPTRKGKRYEGKA
jgi:hypothetical protein